MANLNWVEQKYFEDLFEMGSGYVLDFSNITFQKFIFDSLSIDVYQKYAYESKAKLLRRIINDFDNRSVGKLLMELLEYKRIHLKVNNEEKEKYLKAVEIANKLMGKNPTPKSKGSESKNPQPQFDFRSSLKDFTALSKIENSQKRGYAFEKILHKFFQQNNLDPRGSFKLIGEQIDGSFIFQNETYLLEAKWTKKLIDKSDLVIFNEKVSSKSGFTRGLFISYSSFTEEALKTFAIGRNVNIVLMTVQELVILLSREVDFKSIFGKKVRALAEEGNFFKEIMDII
jgi:hypothetical protein